MCPETFTSSNMRKYHMRYHGKPLINLKCEFCERELSSESNLRKHIIKVHQKIAKCELCKMEFPERSLLKDHLASSHPPCVCKHCGKSFALPRYLKVKTT